MTPTKEEYTDTLTKKIWHSRQEAVLRKVIKNLTTECKSDELYAHFEDLKTLENLADALAKAVKELDSALSLVTEYEELFATVMLTEEKKLECLTDDNKFIKETMIGKNPYPEHKQRADFINI